MFSLLELSFIVAACNLVDIVSVVTVEIVVVESATQFPANENYMQYNMYSRI